METLVTPLFWHDKKVLLTGHTGFKGSWLSLWLHHLGATVCGIARPPDTTPNLFELLQLSEHMESHFLDIRAPEGITEVMHHFQPEIVIHMAAQPLVRYSYQHPVETYHTNVLGTVHVLEAARQCPTVRAILNVTTDKCYENQEWCWGYRENEPLGGYDPYSSSKACSELVTGAYRRSFFSPAGIGLASARAGNVIGGGDWSPDRLVPDILHSLVTGTPLKTRNPKAIRPWQHVLEPLSGYLALIERLYDAPHAYSEAWNFGPWPHAIVSVESLVNHLSALWPEKKLLWDDRIMTSEPHEARHLTLDIAKAVTRLSWQPRLSLKTSLSWIVQWHQAWLRGDNMQTITLDQITQFC